ncbi:MAG TPA: methyltransferase, partial [Kiloniellales bacterium]|nr:methyltransferase [Kiloniellales bacterium]
MTELSPARILEVGSGFWASRTLLSAVEIGLFTLLAREPLTGDEIVERLGLHPRAVPDFPDALLALGFLERDGDGPGARYRNTAETARFLDRHSPHYVGGLLEMFAARLYGFWGNLTEALHSGEPQNEIKATGEPVFAKLYEDPKRLEQFLSAMEGVSAANFRALAQKFDFSRYRTLCDIGGASAQLCRLVAEANPHLKCFSYDLPEVSAVAERKIKAAGLSDRVQTLSGDFFLDPLPRADVITMGMILHDWNLEKKLQLIRAAYDALPE